MLNQRYKFPQKLIDIMKSFHHNTTSKVRAYGCLSESFEIRNGVRQGDVLALNLFNFYLDAMMSIALGNHPNEGLSILFHLDADLVGNKKKMSHRKRLKDLEYADDMCLVAAEKQSLETLLHSVDQACTEMGLDINTKKTKIMSVLPSLSSVHPTAQPVNLGRGREPVDVVNEFQYLGSVVSSSCSSNREIDSRISKASKSFNSLCRVLWYQRKITIKNKIHIFKAVILPILLYACESWVPTVSHYNRLQSFVQRCLRIILGVSMRDNVRNTVIRHQAGMLTVESMIRERRLQWLGHLARMDQSRTPR